MVTEIRTAGATTEAPPRVTPVQTPRKSIDARERIDLVDLATAEIRPHLVRYSLIALAVGFVAGRILR